MKERIEYCRECTKYKLTCNGTELFTTVPDRLICANQDSGSYVIPSPVQVDAFLLMIKLKRALNIAPLQAFVEAIVETSDDRLADAAKYRPALIEKYDIQNSTESEQRDKRKLKRIRRQNKLNEREQNEL